MKKFSFKKIITVSLFFTSVIFTSAFTTYFIPIVSTSHSSDQPNATKIDLHDYDGKTLPEFYKPEPLDNIKEILIGQLENIESTRPVGWEDWECYPNQFEDFVPTLSDTGGSFVLTAKPNAVNYVGGSIATISFNYTNYSKTDISTIITNPMLDATINYDLWNNSTLSKQYILSQFKQMYPILDTNELDITADYSSDAVLKSGIGTATITTKTGSLIYTPSSIDVQFRFKPSLNLAAANVNKIQVTQYWYSDFGTHIDEIKFSIYSANLSRISVFDSFSDSVTVSLIDLGNQNNSYLKVSPMQNGIFYFRINQNLDIDCYPKLKSDYNPIPDSWIDYDEDTKTIKGLKSGTQFDSQYDTLDLSSFSECTNIADSAFSCDTSAPMSLINIQYFGTTAIYKSLSSYFDGSGNPVTRDENLDGPIKFLFLPDSITTLGRSSFRLDYSFDSMLIYPKSFYLVSGTSSLQYLGFTSCLVNQIYELQPINFFNLCFLPFLSGIGMIQNNSAFTFYYHHDKFGTIDGQMIYPKKYALTPCSSGYYFSDGDSNNGEMGFGQKPIFAIGVIDMRDNLLNYTKKWDGTERTDGNTTPYTFYNNYSSDGFFRNFRISDVIFPPEYTTWTTNSFGQGCFGNNYWITNTQSLLTPTGFNNAVGEKFSGIDGQWSNLYLHVPSTLLSQYETTWASIIANAKSLTIIGDADSVI